MKAIKFCYTFMLVIIFSSCKLNCSVGNTNTVKAKSVSSADNSTLTGAIIKNDIELEATDVKLKEAYLMNEQRDLLTTNVTGVNQKIYLVLKLDTGWVKQNGLSYIGAAERISTTAGAVIVDAADIFKDYDSTGLPAADAGAVSLSALITKADPGVDNFIVQFRVWDKKGKGEIKGKYKFSLKK